MRERDGHPLGVLPSLDETEDITAKMRMAGAAIFEDFRDSLSSEELAAAVYIAMEKQRQTEDISVYLAGWHGPASR